MLRFEWDEAKNGINRCKHLIGFETAVLVFDDPNCLTFVERVESGEERWHAIGVVVGTVMLTVAHTYREEGCEEVVRVISARRATPHERRLYVEAL